MIKGLCRELLSKSRQKQSDLFKALLDAPVMHVDGTAAHIGDTGLLTYFLSMDYNSIYVFDILYSLFYTVGKKAGRWQKLMMYMGVSVKI